jgi:hypothetical protein
MGNVVLAFLLCCSDAYAQTPSATEVFNLRSRCAELGQKFVDDLVVGSALTKSLTSRYDSRTNHCYGDVITESIGTFSYHNRSLFDLQTGEILAFAKMERGNKVGMVFGRLSKMDNDLGFTDANEYIDKMMKEDR